VTASLASWLVQSVAAETADAVDVREGLADAEQDRVEQRRAEVLDDELALLRTEVAGLRADLAAVLARGRAPEA
jgi:hypothetical protein